MICTISGLTVSAALAQVPQMERVDSVQALPSGIEVHSGQGVLRVVALRFTMSNTGQMPGNGSWAVLVAARASRVAVTPFTGVDSVVA